MAVLFFHTALWLYHCGRVDHGGCVYAARRTRNKQLVSGHSSDATDTAHLCVEHDFALESIIELGFLRINVDRVFICCF